jgi:hypothetical protein
MLTNLIEGRGKEFSNIVKLGDYLGRSLRENVELFYVENDKVTYLTESGKVIAGTFSSKPNLKLSNIQIDDTSILENQETFDVVADKKVAKLISNLLESDYQQAESSFDGILNLFETKLSFERIRDRLREKTERFGLQTKIIDSPEFGRVYEIKDSIVEFLKENKGIINIPEIKNGMKLASVVAKSFNLPRIDYEDLEDSKVYSVKVPQSNSIYEHLCRQELIAKELLEAKNSFETTWANNPFIADLASMIYEEDQSKVETKIAELVSNTPYFALSTKKQLNTLISNCISLSEAEVPNKDIVSFVGKIFEMKKPVKDYILSILNEKYGINVNNLTDIPTFSNLLKTQQVVINSLARLSPKNSVIKQSLLQLSESLKIKNGSESIDLVEFLNELFDSAGFSNEINETSLMQYLDFNQVADDLGKIGTILKLIRPMVQDGGAGAAGGMPPAAGGMPQQGAGALGQDPMGGVSDMLGGMGGEEDPLPDLGGEEDDLSNLGDDEDGDSLEAPAMDAQSAADMATDGPIEGEDELGAEGGGMVPPEEGAMGQDPAMGIGGEEPEEPLPQVGGDDITNLVADIEDLLASIKSEIGDPNAEPDGDEVEMDDNFEFEGSEAPQEGMGPENGDFDGGGEAEGSKESDPSDDAPEEEKPAKKPSKKPPVK